MTNNVSSIEFIEFEEFWITAGEEILIEKKQLLIEMLALFQSMEKERIIGKNQFYIQLKNDRFNCLNIIEEQEMWINIKLDLMRFTALENIWTLKRNQHMIQKNLFPILIQENDLEMETLEQEWALKKKLEKEENEKALIYKLDVIYGKKRSNVIMTRNNEWEMKSEQAIKQEWDQFLALENVLFLNHEYFDYYLSKKNMIEEQDQFNIYILNITNLNEFKPTSLISYEKMEIELKKNHMKIELKNNFTAMRIQQQDECLHLKEKHMYEFHSNTSTKIQRQTEWLNMKDTHDIKFKTMISQTKWIIDHLNNIDLLSIINQADKIKLIDSWMKMYL